MKEKKQHELLNCCRKAFHIIQHPFTIKIKLNKLGMEGNYLNIKKKKTVCRKPLANIILNGESIKALPLRSRTRQGCPRSPTSVQHGTVKISPKQLNKKKK